MRIERWLMYLQQFDFDLKRCQGNKNLADNLSRHSLSTSPSDVRKSKKRDQFVWFIVQNTTPKAITLEEMHQATQDDPAMTELMKLTFSGKKEGHSLQVTPYHLILLLLSEFCQRNHR